MLEASPSGMSGTYDHLEHRTAKLEYVSDQSCILTVPPNINRHPMGKVAESQVN